MLTQYLKKCKYFFYFGKIKVIHILVCQVKSHHLLVYNSFFVKVEITLHKCYNMKHK